MVSGIVVVLVGAVVAAVLLTSGGGKGSAGTGGAGKGGDQQAPAFTLANLQEGRPELSLSQFRGKPVLLNVWATWCTPCVQEMPMLQAAHARYGDKVQFLGVDRQDYRPDALRFLQQRGVTYPSAYDPNATLDGPYRLRGMPTSVFIDAKGRIVERVTGPLTKSQLDDELKALTEAKA